MIINMDNRLKQAEADLEIKKAQLSIAEENYSKILAEVKECKPGDHSLLNIEWIRAQNSIVAYCKNCQQYVIDSVEFSHIVNGMLIKIGTGELTLLPF